MDGESISRLLDVSRQICYVLLLVHFVVGSGARRCHWCGGRAQWYMSIRHVVHALPIWWSRTPCGGHVQTSPVRVQGGGHKRSFLVRARSIKCYSRLDQVDLAAPFCSSIGLHGGERRMDGRGLTRLMGAYHRWCSTSFDRDALPSNPIDERHHHTGVNSSSTSRPVCHVRAPLLFQCAILVCSIPCGIVPDEGADGHVWRLWPELGGDGHGEGLDYIFVFYSRVPVSVLDSGVSLSTCSWATSMTHLPR
jgi:hypothetical protein